MTLLMIIVVIALLVVLLGFTWYRLEAFEKMERVVICVAGILLSLGITSILFKLSTNGLDYSNIEIKKEMSKILIMVFTPINGIVYMPYLAKIMSRLKFGEMNKSEARKKLSKLSIIVIVIFLIEIKYLNYIQLGIFEIANNL